MGLEPTTLNTLDRALYQLSYRGSSACTCTSERSTISSQMAKVRSSTMVSEPLAKLYMCNPSTGPTCVAAIIISKNYYDEIHVHMYLYHNYCVLCFVMGGWCEYSCQRGVIFRACEALAATPGVAKVVTCWGHNFGGDYNRGHFEFVHARTAHYYCMTCVIQKTR